MAGSDMDSVLIGMKLEELLAGSRTAPTALSPGWAGR